MPLEDIVDNSSSRKVGEILKKLLIRGQDGSKFSAVTAFFNLGGYRALRDGLREVKEFRLLLGKEQDREFVIGKRLREELEECLQKGEDMPPLIKEFKEFLERKNVHVRLYNNEFLHGKAYIVEGEPLLGSVGMVGSSNFTEGGLESNLELNAILKQRSAVEELKAWFEKFWNEAEDYKDELLKCLEPFVEEYTPYEVYMKILYEYFKEELEKEEEKEKEVEERGMPSVLALTDFQEDGYRIAMNILNKYEGVLIADSVGLGKTHLAIKILDEYAYKQRRKALLVCPAQLLKALWEPKLREAAIRVDMVSMEQVGRANFDPGEYADCEIIVVDESHNFRNNSTNRWRNLLRLLRIGKSKKVILLTATPVNNSIWDLFNQIRLITKDSNIFFAGIGITDLRELFREAERNEDIGELYEVLEAIAVRRSRRFIKENYPDAMIDGQRIHFPERELRTVSYSLEECYEGFYESICEEIDSLYLVPYNIDEYKKEITAGLDIKRLREHLRKRGVQEKLINELIEGLGRGRALVDIMKILYLKRLESSIKAFKESMIKQLEFQKAFLECLRRGKLLRADDYRKMLQSGVAEDSEDESSTIEEWLAGLPEVNIEEYNVQLVEKHVEEDMKKLGRILEKVEEVQERGDDKLKRLKLMLKEEIVGRKAVIFTYFKDTAEYIYESISKDNKLQGLLGNISIIHSGVESDRRTKIIQRFAPMANKIKVPEEQQINLLISTDVLSEGQNLQDAQIVINYDLHWNPIRMVQRAGRIDRIGSPYDKIVIYNFVPENELESLINLVERIRTKISYINKSVGLDASVLGETPSPQDINALKRIAEEDESILDELESISESSLDDLLRQQLQNFLKEMGEEKLRRMPWGIGTAKKAIGDIRGLFAAIYDTKNKRYHWLLYDEAWMKKSDKPLVAVKLSDIHPEDNRVEPDLAEVYATLDKMKQDLINRNRQIRHSLETLPSVQSRIIQWLKAIEHQYLHSDDPRISTIKSYLQERLPESHISKLRKLWNQVRKSPSEIIIDALHTFAKENPKTSVPTFLPEEISHADLKCLAWIQLK